MNVSSISELSDKILVNFSIFRAEEGNYTAYGWENDSIWDVGLTPFDNFGYLNESVPESHYKYYFNEQNAPINSIPTEKLSEISMLSNPALIIYALVVGLGVGFGVYTENVTWNSTTIIEATSRFISFDFEIFAGLGVVASPGKWFNLTVSSHHEWKYGKSSNVLLESILDCTVTTMEFNETFVRYEEESIAFGYNTSAIYPQWLVNDVISDEMPYIEIPGYPFLFFGIASLAGIFFVMKKKVK